MHLFTWVDLRTLVACQCPLAAIFAIILLAVRRIYPHLRGTDLLAGGFFLWIPATMLLVAQGTIPAFASVVGSSLLFIGSYILIYRGLLGFFESKGLLPLLYDVAAVASAVTIYFTIIYDVSAPRVVAMAVMVGFARGLMAVDLLCKAKARLPVLFFVAFLGIFAVLPVALALLSLGHGGSGIFITHATFETLNVVSNLVFLSGFGLCGLTMLLDEAQINLEQQGQMDYVTGTLNRAAIEHQLSVEIARSSRTHSPVSVLLIEVDHFKMLTDIHGHSKGDQTLRTVVDTIGSILRFYDKCGRMAEDRFLVLLPENAAEHAMVIASRFREALQLPTLPHDQPAITLSIGVTQCVFKEQAADVLARADLALFEARRKGGDCACLKSDHLQHMHVQQPGPMDRLATRNRVAKLTR